MSKFHELNGKRVEVKRAIPQDRMLATDDGMGVPGDEAAFYGTFGHFLQHGGGGRGGFYAGPYPRGPGGAGMKGRGGGPQQMKNVQNGSQPMQPWMNPPSAGGSSSKASAGAEPTTSEVALNAALSTANSVLQATSAEPQQSPSSNPEDAAINQELGSAFMNLGGNFSSATTALNQGLRTTYGLGSGEAANAPSAAMPSGGQGATATQGGQSPQPGASGELTPQLLQEQLTHLAQQQKLLQQLQQQQLQLQLAQQHQTQQQLQLHMLQQQQQNPSGSGEQAAEQSEEGADAQTQPPPPDASVSAPAASAQEQTPAEQSKQLPVTDAAPATGGDEGNG